MIIPHHFVVNLHNHLMNSSLHYYLLYTFDKQIDQVLIAAVGVNLAIRCDAPDLSVVQKPSQELQTG